MSPDAFVQMCIQIAYFKLYGRCVNTYEPVLTKKYRHGRTEACRVCCKETIELCRGFLDKNLSSSAKIQLLHNAVTNHVLKLKLAQTGNGVDRHLFALKCLSQFQFFKNEWREISINKEADHTPDIFTDKGWETLNDTVISTSNCGNPSLSLFGFGPVVPHGFGIGYIIKDNGLSFCASSKHRQTRRFLDILSEVLKMIKVMLKPEAKVILNRDHSYPGRFSQNGLTSSSDGGEKPFPLIAPKLKVQVSVWKAKVSEIIRGMK